MTLPLVISNIFPSVLPEEFLAIWPDDISSSPVLLVHNENPGSSNPIKMAYSNPVWIGIGILNLKLVEYEASVVVATVP